MRNIICFFLRIHTNKVQLAHHLFRCSEMLDQTFFTTDVKLSVVLIVHGIRGITRCGQNSKPLCVGHRLRVGLISSSWANRIGATR